MATYHGTKGAVNFSTTDADGPGSANEVQCFHWTLTLRHDILDVTPYALAAGDNFKVKQGGMSDAVGTLEFYLDAASANNLESTLAFSDDDKDPTNLVLTTKVGVGSNGIEFTFKALITSLTTEVERQSTVRCTADFQSSDAIVLVYL
jgi:hypothetical protein